MVRQRHPPINDDEIALHNAIHEGNIEMVKTLLLHQQQLVENNNNNSKKVNIMDYKTISNANALITAIERNHNNTFEMVQLLIQHGANVERETHRDASALIVATEI
jgi:ankyrin repeat protein